MKREIASFFQMVRNDRIIILLTLTKTDRALNLCLIDGRLIKSTRETVVPSDEVCTVTDTQRRFGQKSLQ